MSAANSWDDLDSVLVQARQARAEQDELRAHTLYVRATQLDPNSALAWAGRAAMSFDSEDAIVAWGYALALEPHDDHARAMLVQRVQERIAASAAGDAPDLIALGRDLATAGQKSFAHQLFTRATELAPKDAEGWVWRAGSAESTDEVAACLNHALALDPGNKKAEAGLHWLLAEKIAPTQFASPAMARQAVSQFDEGHRLLDAGDKLHAHQAFVHATELDHMNENAWLWRASTTLDVDEALLCVEQALRLDPGNPATRNARQFLRLRKLGVLPTPIAPASESVAPIQEPIYTPASNSRASILLLGIFIIVLILLVYIYFQSRGLVP